MTTVLALECELPNSNLHHFRGKVVTQSGSDERAFTNITMNHMLLRGCKLKNSGYVLGLVIYTGAETRIQQNSAAAPLKIGSFDHFLNMQVAILIMAQIVLCVVCAVLNYSWRETEVRHPPRDMQVAILILLQTLHACSWQSCPETQL